MLKPLDGILLPDPLHGHFAGSMGFGEPAKSIADLSHVPGANTGVQTVAYGVPPKGIGIWTVPETSGWHFSQIVRR